MMKKLFLILMIAALGLNADAQWTNKTMVYGALTRNYRVYKSPNYNAAIPASMVITLHGLGDNMTNFSNIGFNYIADTANIIVVVPQAVDDALLASIYGTGNGTAWNSGAGFSGYYPNSAVNDVGFLNTLIDTVKANYAINPQRVYCCGFSMGGFMTERMALQSNLQIAAFVSMSGTIGSGVTSFAPGRAVPIAHFHGTSDSTVYYAGNLYGIDADSLVHFWVINNGCNPVHDSLRFANTGTDTIKIDRFRYAGTNPNQDVWFYRMIGATHTVLFAPASDINEVMEAWLFMRRHTNLTAGIATQKDMERTLQVYPNPATTFIDVLLPETKDASYTVELFSIQGACLYSKQVNDSFHQILLDDARFSNGMYILRVTGNDINVSQRVMIQR